jgi:hypothetical protein
MKNISTLLLFLSFYQIAFSQNTTQDELNFMSKGFFQMQQAGLDMKKGYYLADSAEFTVQDRKYSFQFFNMRREKNKSLAGTIVIAKSHAWGKDYYIGIPAANHDGNIDLQSTLMIQLSNYAWDTNIKTAFIQALAEYWMILNTQPKK